MCHIVQIKKKLWKSPVVAVDDEFIESNIEEQKMSCVQKNKLRFKRKISPVKNLPVTRLTFDSNEEVEDENLETVNNFADFCKVSLNAHKKFSIYFFTWENIGNLKNILLIIFATSF